MLLFLLVFTPLLRAGDWIEWLADQSKSAEASSSPGIYNAFQQTLALGAAAILDCPSPRIWAEYAMCLDRFSNFVDDIDERGSTADLPPCELTSETVAEQVRGAFQTAAQSLASQSSDAFCLWSKYARWEMDEAMDVFELTQEASEHPGALEPEAAAALTRELTQATSRVNAVFASWLAVPSAHIGEALQALTAWLGSPAGSAIPPSTAWQSQLQDAATSAAERWAVSAPHRERVEAAKEALLQPGADATAAQGELSAAWAAWADAAAAKNQQAALAMLDEAVRSAYWDAALWERYLSACSKLHGGAGATAASAKALCRVSRRACRNCMWHVGFWRKYLHAIEWSVSRGAEPPLHPFSDAHASARAAAAQPGVSPAHIAAHAVGGEASEAAAILSRGDLQAPLHLLAALVWARACPSVQEAAEGPALPATVGATSHADHAVRAANKCFKQAAHQARSVGGDAGAAPIQRLWAEVQCSNFNQWDEGAEKWKALLKAAPKDAFLCVAAASCAARTGHQEQAHEWLKSGLHFQAADAASTMWLQQEWQALNAAHGDTESAWNAQGIIDQRVQAAQQRVAGRAAAAERKAKKRARPEKPPPAAEALKGSEPTKGTGEGEGSAPTATAAAPLTQAAPETKPEHQASNATEEGAIKAIEGSTALTAPTVVTPMPSKERGQKRPREEDAPPVAAAPAQAAPPVSMSAILASLAEQGGAAAVGKATAEALSGGQAAGEQHPAKRPRQDDGSSRPGKSGPSVDEGPSEEALARSGGVDSRTLVMVFVNNLPYKATEAIVQKAFAVAGKVHQVRLRRDDSGKIRGFGTVSLDPNVLPPPPPPVTEGPTADPKGMETSSKDAAAAQEDAITHTVAAAAGGAAAGAVGVGAAQAATGAAPESPAAVDTRTAVLNAALGMDGKLLLGRPLQVSEFKPMSKRWKDVKASGRETKQDLVLPSAVALGTASKRKRTTSATALIPAALRKKSAKAKVPAGN